MLHFLYATSRLVFNELLVVFYINTAMSDIRAVHFLSLQVVKALRSISFCL